MMMKESIFQQQQQQQQQYQVIPLEENMSNLTSASGEASVSSSQQQQSFASPSPNPNSSKKKRSLPGNPDPEAEVIALSPKSLLATNRFMCDICNKGFQRDQNLQLHRRGHNLPWKLKQRSSKEVRKKVYICPEVTCVHHDPSRALGDLTGIKKHFCRKHGEKKWKCDKCSKKYAVQSDWKAHSKTCGTREYRCDCGTVFSRRDSFITHRAFCDALAEESARVISANPNPINHHHQFLFSQQSSSSMLHDHNSTSKTSSTTTLPVIPTIPTFITNSHGFQDLLPKKEQEQQHQDFSNVRLDLPPWLTCQGSSTIPTYLNNPEIPNSIFSSRAGNLINSNSSNPCSLSHLPNYQNSTPSHMSATALLQRAAQMGATMGRPSHMVGPHTSAASSSQSTTSGFHLGLVSQPQEINTFVNGDLILPSLPSSATSGFDGSSEDPFGGTTTTTKGDKSTTRDFLSLKAFSPCDILNMAEFDPTITSSYEQSKGPWNG